MKKATLLLITMILGVTVYAQEFNDYLEVSRQVLKTEKKALIAEVMQLTSEESTAFWPIYNEYEAKKYEVNTVYFKMVQEFSDNFDTMKGEKATEIYKQVLDVEMQLLKLEKTYAKKFAKVLTPQKTFRYLQAENKIKAMIDAEMALQIPLLEAIED